MKSESEKLREILRELPDYVVNFFYAKDSVYQPKTKVAYAIDLRVFLKYLLEAIPDRFPYPSITQIPMDALDQLRPNDIVMFLAYLDEYSMKDADGNYITRTTPTGKEKIQVFENSPSGKRRKLASIKAFFKYMVINEYMTKNPATYVDIPKVPKKPIVALTESETKRLKKNVQTGAQKTEREKVFFEKTKLRDNAIIMLFLGTGIRISELLNIDMYDLDLDEQRLLVRRKGGHTEFVYFKKEVLTALSDYIELERPVLMKMKSEKEKKANGPLFVSNRGTRITINRVGQIVKEYGTFVLPPNVKFSAHLLRKSFGTQLYERSGGDVSLVQHALGHADSSTTTRFYIDFDKNRLKFLKDEGDSSDKE